MERSSVVSVESLEKKFGIHIKRLPELRQKTRIRIPSYYADLIQAPDDPIWKQCMPSAQELEDDGLPMDPLGEDLAEHHPVRACIHKYLDRALLLMTDRCPMYCRFCFRKRLTHTPQPDITSDDVREALRYLSTQTQIREVVLSGGEPLWVPQAFLEEVLDSLKQMNHLKWIRVHTKLPCVDPQALSKEMVSLLARHQPLFVNVHFNHPRELTPLARAALLEMADAGIPLGSQTVLLSDVNNDAAVLEKLFEGLVACRVRPYYLLIADPCQGTSHFRTKVSEAVEIMRTLRQRCSGMMIPQLMMEGPEGLGKVSVSENSLVSITQDEVIYRATNGTILSYPQS